ncbi:MAG: DNA-directed RNA polymerase subunit alpha C-terminal domain-containing protein [Candidatus Paceibacterota bacterium]
MKAKNKTIIIIEVSDLVTTLEHSKIIAAGGILDTVTINEKNQIEIVFLAGGSIEGIEKIVTVVSAETEAFLSTPLGELDLSVYLINLLKAKDIVIIGDIKKHTWDELLKTRGFGEKAAKSLKQLLEEHHVCLTQK